MNILLAFINKNILLAFTNKNINNIPVVNNVLDNLGGDVDLSQEVVYHKLWRLQPDNATGVDCFLSSGVTESC